MNIESCYNNYPKTALDISAKQQMAAIWEVDYSNIKVMISF
ncbi:hypothetical protein [Chryseobacterium hispalense]